MSESESNPSPTYTITKGEYICPSCQRLTSVPATKTGVEAPLLCVSCKTPMEPRKSAPLFLDPPAKAKSKTSPAAKATRTTRTRKKSKTSKTISTPSAGRYRCACCGYSVVFHEAPDSLPRCPSCYVTLERIGK